MILLRALVDVLDSVAWPLAVYACVRRVTSLKLTWTLPRRDKGETKE